MRYRIAMTVVAVALLGSPAAWAATYKLDGHHTTVGFKIRHLFSKVQGTFNEFEGSFVYDPDAPETWTASATVQAASIDTGVESRDKHLRSKDFFHVEQFPTLEFVSTGVSDVTPTSANLNGNLTIHGVTKPVTLAVVIHGVGADPWGSVRSGFTATTTINRTDFGLTWNETLETGRLLVGEELQITIEVEGILQEG